MGMPKSIYDTRRDNLRRLSQEWGGPTSLAKKLGHSNGSALAQVIGPNPRRMVGERMARDVEKALNLRIGWLDQDHSQTPVRDVIKDELLAQVVAAVATVVQDADVRVKPAAFADLVALVYEQAARTGRIDEQHIQRLVRLTQ